MFRKALRKLFAKREAHELIELDELYKETIVQLPLEARIHYCENLIRNCMLDIDKTKDSVQLDKLKRLMNAAKHEIERMNK